MSPSTIAALLFLFVTVDIAFVLFRLWRRAGDNQRDGGRP